MLRNIRFRIGGILFLVFMAAFFNFNEFEFTWYQTSWICEDYDWRCGVCSSGENFLNWQDG